MSHDPSEIILIYWFAAQQTFLIIVNVEIYWSSNIINGPINLSILRISKSILSLVFNQMCDDAEFNGKHPFGKVEVNYKDINGLHCTGCALFNVTLEVCGLARRYFPYKCSTKSSFMWFGMQWTDIFKIWTSLTEGCFQFHMLTRFVCVDCSRIRLCATPCKWFNVHLKMILWCKINVNTSSYVLRD